MSKREIRSFPVEGLRIERAEDGKPKIRGHAAVFNSETVIAGVFREKVAPGAFAKSIARGDDVRSLFNHNRDIVLGRTKSNTLSLREDETGLATVTDPPDTQAARDLMVSIDRHDIDQMSFAFEVPAGGEEWVRGGKGEMDLRILKELDLYDVSPVTFAAYEDTDVGVRAHAEFRSAQHADGQAAEKQKTDARARAMRMRLRMIEIQQGGASPVAQSPATDGQPKSPEAG